MLNIGICIFMLLAILINENMYADYLYNFVRAVLH